MSRVFVSAFAMLSFASMALADEMSNFVVPQGVIYPGEVLRRDVLNQIEIPLTSIEQSKFAKEFDEVVGKVATTTLLPRGPIKLSSISAPAFIPMGAAVQIRYVRGNIWISSGGVALQKGVVGERIRVRNSESQVTVQGVVRPDGSVHVSDP